MVLRIFFFQPAIAQLHKTLNVVVLQYKMETITPRRVSSAIILFLLQGRSLILGLIIENSIFVRFMSPSFITDRINLHSSIYLNFIILVSRFSISQDCVRRVKQLRLHEGKGVVEKRELNSVCQVEQIFLGRGGGVWCLQKNRKPSIWNNIEAQDKIISQSNIQQTNHRHSPL